MSSSLLQADNETCIAWLEGSVGGSDRAKPRFADDTPSPPDSARRRRLTRQGPASYRDGGGIWKHACRGRGELLVLVSTRFRTHLKMLRERREVQNEKFTS
jgi:hypothetical protein